MNSLTDMTDIYIIYIFGVWTLSRLMEVLLHNPNTPEKEGGKGEERWD